MSLRHVPNFVRNSYIYSFPEFFATGGVVPLCATQLVLCRCSLTITKRAHLQFRWTQMLHQDVVCLVLTYSLSRRFMPCKGADTYFWSRILFVNNTFPKIQWNIAYVNGEWKRPHPQNTWGDWFQGCIYPDYIYIYVLGPMQWVLWQDGFKNRVEGRELANHLGCIKHYQLYLLSTGFLNHQPQYSCAAYWATKEGGKKHTAMRFLSSKMLLEQEVEVKWSEINWTHMKSVVFYYLVSIVLESCIYQSSLLTFLTPWI